MLADVDGTLTPSLSLEMARMVFGGDRFVARGGAGGLEGVAVGDCFVPTQEDGTVWIRRGAHDPERFVSAAFVLDGDRAPSLLRGKLVIVDLIARGQSGSHGDASDARVAPGEVQAEVLESVVAGTTLVRPRWALWIEGALMACVGLAISWVFPRMRKRALLPLLALTMAGIWLSGLAAYAQARLLVDVLSPISIVFVMFFLMLADSLVREEATRHSLAERLSDEERHRRLLEGDLESQREQAAKARGEMEAATRIQRGMLPDVRALFSSESRLDVAALMNPARHVGGDLYDCFMLDEHRAFFVVGDVCGKGIPASLFMAICKTLCKSLALRYASLVLTRLNPGTLVRQLNQEIARDNPEEFFVTGFFAVLDLRSGDLSYCNAGHDNPFVCSRSLPPRELDGAKGPPVCILDDFDYPTHHERLSPGDVLCVYTDGVTEAFDPQQREYGKDRLLRVLSKQWDRVHAQEILEATCESVRAFTSGADPSDDLTMLVLRWSP